MSTQDRLSILVVSDFFHPAGGVETLLLSMLKSWCVRYDVSLMSFYQTPAPPEPIASRIVNRYRVLTIYPSADYEAEVLDANNNVSHLCPLGKMDYDVVIAMKEGPITKVARYVSGKRHISFCHSDYVAFPWTPGYFKFGEPELEVLSKFDSVICVSKGVRDSILATIGDPGNLVVRDNPIDVDVVRRRACEPAHNLPPKHDGVTRFVMIGRQVKQKNYKLMIEACTLLREQGLDNRYEVLIAGSYTYRKGESVNVAKLAAQAKFPQIHVLGWCDNPYPLLASADWYLSTSEWEGYSIAAQEAICLGIPAILTDVGGARDLVETKRPSGIVVQKDAASVAHAMQRAINSRLLHQFLAWGARNRAKDISFDYRLYEIERLFSETPPPDGFEA